MSARSATPNSAPALLTVLEVCDQLRISRWTFYRLVQRNQLRTVKIGSSRRVTPEAVAAFVASLSDAEGR